MIDIYREDLQEVRILANKAFRGRISPATLYRWIVKGANGQKLDAVKVGRKWFTTPDAFSVFINAQTEAATGAAAPTSEASPYLDVSEDELRNCGLL